MPNDYTRPVGERFVSKGIRTGSAADAMTEGQYPFLQNVRAYTPTELTTRPGLVFRFFTTIGSAIRAIAEYSGGFLAAAAGTIYNSAGAAVDSGYQNTVPAMLPARPNQSPDAWMYVGDEIQYHKIPPTGAAQNVGIAEPQAAPEAYTLSGNINLLSPLDAWGNSGTAGAVGGATRSTDLVGAVFADPVSGAAPITAQVSPTIQYQREQLVSVNGGVTNGRVQDVFTPIPSGISILSIKYLSGATGRCVVVPNLLPSGPGSISESIYAQSIISNLRRGALVQIGAEICYVYDVETGPLGTICFTTVTTGAHTTADSLSGVSAIQLESYIVSPGDTLTSQEWDCHVAAGIGTIQITPLPSLFQGLFSFQLADYLHFSVNIDDLSKLTEMKILIDVNTGAANFTDNVYFYAVRPSDIQAGVANTLTQLGVTQVYAQRQLIQQEQVVGVSASAQTVPGNSQWSEIIIPLSEFVRIGDAQSQTLTQMKGIQFLFNVSGGVDVAISSVTVHGSYQVDVGLLGQPYQYRVRPRSSVTGARGNPSPATRYGLSPRRQQVQLIIPGRTDPQTDLWDVFRMGGTLDTFRLVGTLSAMDFSSAFIDNYSDSAIALSEVLEYDNLQPWPTIDNPLSVDSGVSVTGYIVTFTLGPSDDHLATIPRYLPGNLVRLGQTVYTLYTRPTVVGTAITMTLVENAGAVTNGALYIYEPLMANQPLPYLWGPSAEGGTIFGVGDPYRSGTVYFSKNFNPDSAPDRYNIELTPPSEPLVGGCLLNGESFAASSARWWALRPSFGGQNQYTPRQVPVGHGAVSHWAMCSDGKRIYFVGKDGVYAHSGGPATLLTPRETIYTLFPHEGRPGQDYTYAGNTLRAPDYRFALLFQLHCANGYLYFDYQSSDGIFRNLTCDLATGAWYPDSYTGIGITTHYTPPQLEPIQNVPTLLLLGDNQGNVLTETPNVNDNGTDIDCIVCTREMCPDDRAFSWFGDLNLDILPTNNPNTGTHLVGTSLGAVLANSLGISSATRNPRVVVPLGGGQTLKSLGLQVTWAQSYAGGETQPVVLYAWQPSWVPKPESIEGRYTDWYPNPAAGNRFWQGFLMEADTSNVQQSFIVRDGDTLTAQQQFAGTFNGQSQQAFSFTLPFVAHNVRLEPIVNLNWRLFNIEWVSVPYPESARVWRSEGTSHGSPGFQHLYMGQLAYVATQPVIVTLRFDQGTTRTITLPATGLRLDPVKIQFKIPFNKWKIVSYEAASPVPFYLWEEDVEFWSKPWGSTDPYAIIRPFGGKSQAPVALV